MKSLIFLLFAVTCISACEANESSPEEINVEDMKHILFVSSISYEGSQIGGVDTADIECKSLAGNKGFRGDFKALLSTSKRNIRDDIVLVRRIENTLGGIFAKAPSLFWADQRGEPILDEESNEVSGDVWTGTLWTGMQSMEGNFCDDWTGNGSAMAGSAGQTDRRLFEDRTIDCSETARIFCVSQFSKDELDKIDELDPVDNESGFGSYQKFDFEDFIGAVEDGQKIEVDKEFEKNGLKLVSAQSEKVINIGAGYSSSPFNSDAISVWTFSEGAKIELPFPAKKISFEVGQFTPAASPGNFNVVVNEKTVKSFTADHTEVGDVEVNLDDAVAEFHIMFSSGSLSLLTIDNLVLGEEIDENVTSLDFEDFLGSVEGYGQSKQSISPVTISGVTFTSSTQTPEVWNFADGYSNHPDYGLNESFETDYLGLFAYYDGVEISFPLEVSNVEFEVIYCACTTQPTFELIVDGATAKQFTTPSQPLETAHITLSLPSANSKITIKYLSGSSGLLKIDNLSWN